MSSGAKEPLLPRHRPTRFGAAAGGIPRSVFGLPILRPDTGFYRAWSALILFLDLTYSALVVGVGRLGGRGDEIVCVRVGRSVCVWGGGGRRGRGAACVPHCLGAVPGCFLLDPRRLPCRAAFRPCRSRSAWAC